MYIKNFFTKNKIVLTVVLFYFILIFPIFFGANIRFNLEEKRIFAIIKLFGVKVFSFYIDILSEGLIIHLTKKYAVIVPFAKIFDVRKKVEPLKDYHIIRFSSVIEIASEENPLFAYSIAHVLRFFNEFVLWFFTCYKPYLKINNITNADYGKNELKINIKFTIVFNLLMVIFSIIKIGVGKLNYAIKK